MDKIIDGKSLANEITEDLKKTILSMDKKPCLSVILVGEDPASQIYVKNKQKKAESIGIESKVYKLSSDTKETDLLHLIDSLNEDKDVNGILVQLPLPKHINEDKIIQSIKADKDVDGFSHENIAKLFLGDKSGFVSCTPKGIVIMLEKYVGDLSGLNACIVGRSNIVGKPLSLLLLSKNCSVDICHSKTIDLKSHCKRADILISCVGKEKLITEDMVKDSAIIIDVGINRNPDTNKLTGDVDFDKLINKAHLITPVPGGVG
ncbi:MAG: bifunctional 5,10-methylenetetrahydrofolate dehydrogenase/5,10-methenyltetrahydrofolate cyclohydrolase, partial [Alphaproteobacteria bacterium]|nr:bifunctional 5,10-methylenetetrahydrofolate dehydrogenase/5,10-methenyltetrahydrofolate cyclohydrolase [Alphaproteobacteria bacterium]